jgi:hypothetical protein
VIFELHKRNSSRLFRNNVRLEEHLGTMEKYLNAVANNDKSQERSGFSSNGFRSFADVYEAAGQIRREIASQ